MPTATLDPTTALAADATAPAAAAPDVAIDATTKASKYLPELNAEVEKVGQTGTAEHDA